MNTRTGNYPIGFRLAGSEWQQELAQLIDWSRSNGLAVIDLRQDGDRTAKTVIEAGLRVGSVDLPEWHGMLAPDKARRAEAIAQNGDYIRACAACGPLNHFVVMLPAEPALPPAENFGYMVESFSQLAPVFEQNQARLVIEGWPGPGALCCTPEGLRAFFKECPSPALGLNYDPSHLIRMNIDPLRFLQEFSDRVFHVHGKDTALLTENLYEFGSELPAIFARPIPHGRQHWRYTIPGHGQMRWVEVLRLLETHGYSGCVSIELEDANFYGTEAAEKTGILQAARFLEGC